MALTFEQIKVLRSILMMTPAEGLETFLAALPANDAECTPLQLRLKDQIKTIATGDNAYFAFEHLPDSQKARYGSIAKHPWGLRLCWRQWLISGAMTTWSEGWVPYEEREQAQAA